MVGWERERDNGKNRSRWESTVPILDDSPPPDIRYILGNISPYLSLPGRKFVEDGRRDSMVSCSLRCCTAQRSHRSCFCFVLDCGTCGVGPLFPSFSSSTSLWTVGCSKCYWCAFGTNLETRLRYLLTWYGKKSSVVVIGVPPCPELVGVRVEGEEGLIVFSRGLRKIGEWWLAVAVCWAESFGLPIYLNWIFLDVSEVSWIVHWLLFVCFFCPRQFQSDALLRLKNSRKLFLFHLAMW